MSGILNETVIVDPSDPVNLRVVGNYRVWPQVKSIFACMDGGWAWCDDEPSMCDDSIHDQWNPFPNIVLLLGSSSNG